MDNVSAVGQGLSKGNLEIRGACFEREVLITEGGRPADFIDGYYDEREIEVVIRAVGDLNRTINAIAANLRSAKPFEHQASRDHGLKLFADSVSRTGGVFNSHGVGEFSKRRRTAYQDSLGSKGNPFRQITRCDTPVVGRNAAASGQRNAHFHSGVERG